MFKISKYQNCKHPVLKIKYWFQIFVYDFYFLFFFVPYLSFCVRNDVKFNVTRGELKGSYTSTNQTSFTRGRHSVFVFIASKKVNMSKRPKLSGAQGRKKRKEEEEKRDKDKGNVTVKMMLMILFWCYRKMINNAISHYHTWWLANVNL